jgi:hypothetical protein
MVMFSLHCTNHYIRDMSNTPTMCGECVLPVMSSGTDVVHSIYRFYQFFWPSFEVNATFYRFAFIL